MNSRMNKQDGFSLLEVLVAFTIMVLGLAVILQIFGRGNQTTQLTLEYALAAQIAESRLAQLAEYDTIKGLSTTGHEMDRYEWSLTVMPYDDMNQSSAATSLTLYSVRVNVRWQSHGKSRHISLESMRLLPVSTG